MHTKIKIVLGKHGFLLKIGEYFLALRPYVHMFRYGYEWGYPSGVAEFVSISALREFWGRYKEYLLALVESDIKKSL